MDDLIIQAITERRILSFSYKGTTRQVEPHTYGNRHDGRDALCAWQVTGGSGTDFRLFFVGEMSALSIERETFEASREDYQRGDSRFSHIYAEI